MQRASVSKEREGWPSPRRWVRTSLNNHGGRELPRERMVMGFLFAFEGSKVSKMNRPAQTVVAEFKSLQLTFDCFPPALLIAPGRDGPHILTAFSLVTAFLQASFLDRI
eukprot:EG_transcript_36504